MKKLNILLKRNNILFPLTVALAFALSGCLSENCEIIECEAYRDISLRIAQTSASRNTTDGISLPIPHRTPLEFVDGNLFMVTADGVIMRHYRIIPGNSLPTTTTNNSTVGRDLLLAPTGALFQSVPGSVTRVVIIGNFGNASGTPSLPTAGNINSTYFLGRKLDIESQYNAWRVNLTNCPARTFTPTSGGAAMLNGNLYFRNQPPGGNRVYATTIHLAPTVARFEIAEIAGAGRIRSFTIDGIFMDGFYRQARINSTLIPSSLHTGGDEPDNFTDASHSFDANFGIHDWRGTRAWSGHISQNPATLVVRPSDAPAEEVFHPAVPEYRYRYHVWAYQVFARDYHIAPAANQGTRVPRIIIRFSNVRIMHANHPEGVYWNYDGYNNGVAFLTICEIRNQENGKLLEYIRASRVYHFERITFYEGDLADVPNRNAIDGRVRVALAAWHGVYIGIII